MLGDHSPDIKLGSVIYGRVSGYPWWPAVVAKCPNTHQWTNDDKVWVYFFNDTTGAWLKASQIRSFDGYNHDLCHEHNSSVAKFRRYQERINKAVSIAETHVKHSSKAIRVKVLPPRRSPHLGEGSRSDTASGEHVASRQHDTPTALRHYSKRKPPLTREREASDSDVQPCTQHHSADNDHSAAENAGVAEARPKRKRKRSIRYVQHDNMPATRQPERKAAQKLDDYFASKQHAHPAAVSAETVMQPKKSEHEDALTGPAVQARRRSLRLRPSTEEPSFDGLTGKRSRRKRVRSHSLDSCKEKREGIVKSSTLPSSGSVGPIHGESSFEKAVTASAVNGQAGNKTTKVKRRDERVGMKSSLTKHMYVNELKEVARISHGSFPCASSGIKSNGGVRSLLGVRSRPVKDVGALDDCTDSEERPDRERKVNVGSLEVAAEDLLEHAIRGCRSYSSDPNDNAPEGPSIAFNNGDLVSSILNRLSNLEKDVSLLKKRATSEEQATLGEDVTAAGVKSAVEALAASSVAFAKARDYNVAVIRRSMEVLWPDGQFPLAGADGDLLRTVAQSLILASCKRRQAEISKVANETHDSQMAGHETEQRSLSVHCLVPPGSTPVSAEEIDNCQYEKDRRNSLQNETKMVSRTKTQSNITRWCS